MNLSPPPPKLNPHSSLRRSNVAFLLATVWVFTLTCAGNAQTPSNNFYTIARFALDDANIPINGESGGGEDTPVGSLVRLNGEVYGVCNITAEAGSSGRIYKVNSAPNPPSPDGYNKINLHTFHTYDPGYSPTSGLILASDGNFYGTTANGYQNAGSVYKMTPDGVFTTIHQFTNYDGDSPASELLEGPDGYLYGTTEFGGATAGPPQYRGNGTIFKISKAGAFTLLHSFDSQNPFDGAGPKSALINSTDGNFYGVTTSGGIAGRGTLYKLTPAGVFSIVYDFGSGSASTGVSYPSGSPTIGPDGNFYGPCLNGGYFSNSTTFGLIYKITPSGVFSVLYAFKELAGNPDAEAHTGVSPYGKLALMEGRSTTLTDATLYGTTSGGGPPSGEFQKVPSGVLFALKLDGTYTVLHVFHQGNTVPQNEGFYPIAPLLLNNRQIIGSTNNGGGASAVYKPESQGTIFVQNLGRN